MAAMVAQHNSNLWHRRPDEHMHAPHMPAPNLLPFDASARPASTPNVPRAFQNGRPDVSMPIFQSAPIASTVSYHPPVYVFDNLAANPYGIQQSYAPQYPPALNHNASSYPGASQMAPGLPHVREARNGFGVPEPPQDHKAEAVSPVRQSPMAHEPPPSKELHPTGPADADGGVSFSTDVDTLMRAIQSQSQQPPRPRQTGKVRSQASAAPPDAQRTDQTRKITKDVGEAPRASGKSKKRYLCTMPNCAKSFYQKTHLEIHIRAHTGVKPFVSTRFHPSKTVEWLDPLKLSLRCAKNRRAARGFRSSVT